MVICAWSEALIKPYLFYLNEPIEFSYLSESVHMAAMSFVEIVERVYWQTFTPL